MTKNVGQVFSGGEEEEEEEEEESESGLPANGEEEKKKENGQDSKRARGLAVGRTENERRGDRTERGIKPRIQSHAGSRGWLASDFPGARRGVPLGSYHHYHFFFFFFF